MSIISEIKNLSNKENNDLSELTINKLYEEINLS